MGPAFPAELLPEAGALALLLVWPRMRSATGTGRLALEAAGLALLATSGVWVAWVVLWLIEQRW